MVKNVNGGKHKNQARKFLVAPSSSRLRLPEDEMECFAKVTSMSGNGMCCVNVAHKDSIIEDVCCHIRGKFRGKHKSHNLVSRDSVLLIGLRDWTSDLKHCDLLEVYTDIDATHLNLPASFRATAYSNPTGDQVDDYDEINFSNNIVTPSAAKSVVDMELDTNMDFDLELDGI